MMISVNCPFCNATLDPSAYFCPTCGKKVREKPLSTSFSALAVLYAVSLFLPPFGIGLTMKYLKSGDPAAKRAGLISVILTCAALVFVFWSTYVITKNVSDQVNEAMNKYQGLGY